MTKIELILTTEPQRTQRFFTELIISLCAVVKVNSVNSQTFVSKCINSSETLVCNGKNN